MQRSAAYCMISCQNRIFSSIVSRFTVTIQKKVKEEGAKRPKWVDEDLDFGYDEIKYTKYLISFK